VRSTEQDGSGMWDRGDTSGTDADGRWCGGARWSDHDEGLGCMRRMVHAYPELAVVPETPVCNLI